MSGAAHVQLVFGSSRIDVAASMIEGQGALRVIAREAEQQFGLSSDNYGFYDSFGKIDTPAALQRAVKAAHGICQLEIRENSEGRIMREIHSAMKSLEERMMMKMSEAITSIRGDLEPAVKSVVDEQSRCKAKIDGMLDDMLAMRSDSLAVEEELNKRIDSLAQDCFAMRVDTVAGEEELTARLDALTNVRSVKELEDLEEQLQAELETQALRDFDLITTSENIDQILADVRGMEERQDCRLAADDEYKADKVVKQQANESAKGTRSSLSMPWDTIVKCTSGISFDGKVCIVDDLKLQNADVQKHQPQWDGLRPSFGACRAPFAQGGSEAASLKNVSRFHVEGLRGLRPVRSTPVLSPLK